ncbi:PTS sugar transporter subunit IIB [Anaeromicropila herbilytica]|uniref:PTS sugar transporter subunit IIB n=1 Tax=Anaeromicropila herbilytica TaxID=2785025 RepID=A0A7R7IDN0_9FIRM|nr:PTS sugar transporter subunit IIB [Anaeromicropila herbilytica]BCN31131.1 PTS sugar transporter subunit IIB [Anaeromicropila herbilytica]
MRNIVLLCNMGMSTSLMVNKMRETAKEEGYECEINAYALQKAEEIMASADILLIGPQIAYELGRLKQTYPDKKIEAIDMMDYGRMDGKKVLHHVKDVLGD